MPVEMARADFGKVFNELCHLVALSRTSKIPQVVESLVQRALVYGTPPDAYDAQTISRWVAKQYGAAIPASEVEFALDGLVRAGAASRPAGHFLLTESRKAGVQRVVEKARELETRVRAEWLSELHDREIASRVEHERLWACLRAYMLRVLRRHGALAAHVLNPSVPTESGVAGDLNTFLAEAGSESGIHSSEAGGVRQAVNLFFEEPSGDRTAYIAQHLDAAFTFFALSEPDSTAAYLRGQMQPLDVLVDTNFVLDLLFGGEDDHIAVELVSFVRDNKLPIRLLYHERTRRELSATLSAIGANLRRRHWSQSLSRAHLREHRGGGVLRKYHELNAKCPTDPDVFMGRYENHLTEELRTFGIEACVPSDREPEADERRHLLVAEYQAFVKEHRPDKEKRYETADHDIAVWLAVQERRRKGATSTLESGALFLSNDQFFRFFDDKVLRGLHSVTVVLPRTLLQVLRPFATPSGDYDRRFVKAFAAAEFRTAHSDYEKTTAELMSHLAAFGDLPEETAVKVLGDELLRTRLEKVRGTDDAGKLVRDKVIDLNASLVAERDASRELLSAEESEATDLRRHVKLAFRTSRRRFSASGSGGRCR